MKSLLVLLGVVIFMAVAQRRPQCPMDPFSVARTCQMGCLFISETGCPRCNQTCNATRCPPLERCTLGCVLRRASSGCPTCQCRDDTDGGILDSCTSNVAGFAVLETCNLRCIERNDDGCFMCNRTCNATADTPVARDECGSNRECSGGAVCVLERNLNQCVDRIADGELCEREDPRDLDDGDEDDDDDEFTEELDEDDHDFFLRIDGAIDRLRAFALQSSAEIEASCDDGFRCSDESGTCTEITGPCIAGRSRNLRCNEDGDFEPLQCLLSGDGTHTCQCVHPRNGTRVPGTVSPEIRSREEAPDCESRVFRQCVDQQGGRNFRVHHGEIFVNRSMCMRCRCNDGNGVECRSVNCSRLNPGTRPRDCTRGDITVEHGSRKRVGKCNMCGCNNGRLTCTDIEECKEEGEERDVDERRCGMCQDVPMSLVCGRDGRTFKSRCIAMNCSRLRDNDTINGPCPSQDICNLYPCQSGFACIPLGGRSCLRNEGCTADERRICVDRKRLRCRVSNRTRDGFSEVDEDMVCGSDRRTYRSLCHLIQQAPPNTSVAHAGRCDRKECNSGQVCGTDGVTYNNTCHLRAQSANAQMDYKGQCVDDGGRNLREICRRVRDEENRCENNRSTCERRVMSRDGCCPVCGGITTLAIDRDALDEYSRATDSDANLDEFMSRMTRDDVISDDVRRRCKVEVTHVRNSTEANVEVKMMAKNKMADADFCHTSCMKFADKINNASNTSTTSTSTLPVQASFASAAVAAPLIADTPSGAPGVTASCLAVLAAALMAAIF